MQNNRGKCKTNAKNEKAHGEMQQKNAEKCETNAKNAKQSRKIPLTKYRGLGILNAISLLPVCLSVSGALQSAFMNRFGRARCQTKRNFAESLNAKKKIGTCPLISAEIA